jgi:hypothetical protein
MRARGNSPAWRDGTKSERLAAPAGPGEGLQEAVGPATSPQPESSCSQLRKKQRPSLEGGPPRVRPLFLLSSLDPACCAIPDLPSEREGPVEWGGEAPRPGTFRGVPGSTELSEVK